jgi:hypothetical protein
MESKNNKHLFEHKDNILIDDINLIGNPGKINQKKDDELDEGKKLIIKFFEEKCERKKKILNMKRERIMEDFRFQESRIMKDIELEKAKKLSEFEEAFKMKTLNKKLKLKSHEGSGEFLSLNDSDDAGLDMINESRAKLQRK